MLSEIGAGFQSSMVNGLKNMDIELLCLKRVKGHVKRHEGIGETLHTKANRAMVEVQTTCFRNWIVVLTIDDDGWESKRGKVANGCLVRGGVFDDFCAEVQ